MKKIFIPTLIFAAAISSCSEDLTTSVNNGDTDARLLTINASSGDSSSRATDVTTSTLENSTGVKLHINDSGAGGDHIFDGYDFVANGSDWSQSTSSLTWDDIALPARFFSMHDGEPKELTMSSTSASMNYKVTGTSAEHKDLVYYAGKLEGIPAGGRINAYHKHALSKINLYAATGGNKVYVANISLVNIDGNGTVTIQPLSASDSSITSDISWLGSNVSDQSYQYFYIGNSAAKALISAGGTDPLINEADDAPLMIIPQSTTAATQSQIEEAGLEIDNSYVKVIYYVTDADDVPLVGYSSVKARPDAKDYVAEDQSKTLYVMGAFPVDVDFAANFEYDMTLGLGKDGSTGGYLIADYYVDKDGNPVSLTKVDEGTATKPVPIPGIDEGDEILGGSDDELDLDVTVGPWGDTIDKELK